MEVEVRGGVEEVGEDGGEDGKAAVDDSERGLEDGPVADLREVVGEVGCFLFGERGGEALVRMDGGEGRGG